MWSTKYRKLKLSKIEPKLVSQNKTQEIDETESWCCGIWKDGTIEEMIQAKNGITQGMLKIQTK